MYQKIIVYIGLVIIFIFIFSVTLLPIVLDIKTVVSVFRKKLLFQYREYYEKAEEEETRKKMQQLIEIERLGKFAFFQKEIRIFINRHKLDIVLGIFILLFSICVYSFYHDIALPSVKNIDLRILSLLICPLMVIILLGFLLSNRPKYKLFWITSWTVIVFLYQVWLGIVEKRYMVWLTIPVWVIAHAALVYHYLCKWEKENRNKYNDLQQRLQEINVENDMLLQEYLVIQEQKHDSKKHLSA